MNNGTSSASGGCQGLLAGQIDVDKWVKIFSYRATHFGG